MLSKKIKIKDKDSQSNWLILGVILMAMSLTTLIVTNTTATASANQPPQNQNLQALFDKANDFGQVRVIVGLDIDFIPEGELATVEMAQSQQQAIASAQNQVWQQLANTNSQLIANFEFIPYLAAIVDLAALDKLADLPQVISIQEDKLSAPTLASSIPVIGADTAWANGLTGSGQTVVILDTGVDKTHSFFSGGKVVSEACYSSTGVDTFYGPYYSVCPGGALATAAPGSGVNCPISIVGCDHGTHVAGIAAGNGGGGPNIGVAKDADIIAIQVFSNFTNFNTVFTFDSDQILGLQRAYQLRNTFEIAAVNMSLGGLTQHTSACDSDPRKAAIDVLRSAGIATIIATGNGDDSLGYGYRTSMSAPACISSAISVGATEDDDDVAIFANIAPFMDLLAPGVNITSSVPGNSTGTFGGTSMAAPHVAGAWAVLKSSAPSATVNDTLAALIASGTMIDDNRPPIVINQVVIQPAGSVNNIPRINVDLAINSLSKPNATNDAAATPLDTAVTINVLANDSDPNNDPLTILSVGAPGHGTAVKTGNSILYTPTTSYSGVDNFTYTISDGNGNEDSATVMVIVDGESIYLPALMKN